MKNQSSNMTAHGQTPVPVDRRFSVAPMMDWTDRHCRYFHRVMTRHTLLYTEMVTSPAIVNGDREHLLGFDEREHPVALQVGGSDPLELGHAAKIGAEFGYDEINLNVGCPSDRVQSGSFGACLMASPGLVADGVKSMLDAVGGAVDITVKCRIGIDQQDSEADLARFVDTVAAAGCRTFVIHARKAWLEGLSPKENRDVPPLDYDRVYRLKQARPDLEIILNGGIAGLQEAQKHLEYVDGAMLGRAAYHQPGFLRLADAEIFGAKDKILSLNDIIAHMLPYIEAQLVSGAKLHQITRHMIGLFHGCKGARAYRRYLSENAYRPGAGPEVLRTAAAFAVDGQAAELCQEHQ